MATTDADLQHGQHRIAKLWIDGHAVSVQGATFENDPTSRKWRVSGHLPDYDPFAKPYGVSMQLETGMVLHGSVRMIERHDGVVVFEGDRAPEGGWI